MIERAQSRQSELGLTNLTWLVADSYGLPFDENSFSLVLTRFSFHHLLDRQRALREMARVCRIGGRVAVVDVTPEEGKTEAYDRLERLRDPSHVSTLSAPALVALSNGDQLHDPVLSEHLLEISLDAQLASSFPEAGDSERIRQMVYRDIGRNQLGVNAYEREDEIFLRLPISTVVWQKRQVNPDSKGL
jgi:ubiquinone/menaquinone biosynthesis C-methylase UbiE